MRVALVLFLATALQNPSPRGTPTPPPQGSGSLSSVPAGGPAEAQPPRPEDKTLVASLDVEQGEGKERLTVYVDGTLALVKTYLGVQTLKKKVLSEVEVDFVRRVCSEALSLDVSDYAVDALRRGEPRRFRIEVGRPGALPRVFTFDEFVRVPLVLGRARGTLEGLVDRFDESTVSQDDLWDSSKLRTGDVLVRRADGKRYRIVRDDTFVRSLEMLEVERTLQRLVILREDVPRIFHDPAGKTPGGPSP